MSDASSLSHLLRAVAEHEKEVAAAISAAASARADLCVHLANVAEIGGLPAITSSSAAAAAAAAAATAAAGGVVVSGKEEDDTNAPAKRGQKRSADGTVDSKPARKARIKTAVTERVWKHLWGDVVAWRQADNLKQWLILSTAPPTKKAALTGNHGRALTDMRVQKLEFTDTSCVANLPTFETPNSSLTHLRIRSRDLTRINPTIVQLTALTHLHLYGMTGDVDITMLFDIKTLVELVLESVSSAAVKRLPALPRMRRFTCRYFVEDDAICMPSYRPIYNHEVNMNLRWLIKLPFLETMHEVYIDMESSEIRPVSSTTLLACRLVSRMLKMGLLEDVTLFFPQDVTNRILQHAFPEFGIMRDSPYMETLRSEHVGLYRKAKPDRTSV